MASLVDQYIQCLLAIPADELAKDEKNCCICLNEYEKRNPEGLMEYAAAPPKEICGHVNGNLWLARWLKQDGRGLLCRFVLFHMRTVEVKDDDPADDDFVLAAAPRVVLHDDDSSEDSVDQSNSDGPIKDEEAVLSRAIATFGAVRPRTSDEIDEMEAAQPGFGGVASIRRRGVLADFELYHDISMKELDAALRAASGGHELPELLTHIPRSQRVLTREADKALIEQLQDIGAFTQP